MKSIVLRTKLWKWQGQAAWHFLTINQKTSREIKKLYSHNKRGWGSQPVLVKIGKTTWKTSIFPDSKSGTYVLPVKKEIRLKESLREGKTVKLTLKILEN